MALNLEKYLVLNKFFLSLFGFSNFNQLREKLKDIQEGYDTMGRTFFINVLIDLKPEWDYQLIRYDETIREYVEKLKQNRKQLNFSLKYFQYLAVLFTEIFLDKFYNNRREFLTELNKFLELFNNENKTKIKPFTEQELRKLAFWMATGSGKTLIMHINYWQILKYSDNDWDNIILITPTKGLAKQHYEELKLSGIPCKLYDGNIYNLKTKNREILIIDIYKLTKEKTGKGLSVDISWFEGKNLVFIDEGHKGQKSEEKKWKQLREELGKNGFLFEYSATFGQVIGRNKNLLEEYAKAIILDYSYKYFYLDGYGKDFYVYNIKNNVYAETQKDLILTAGLLSFYEQLVVFENYKKELREYNIEKPLWVFVGSKVSGKGINSDIVRVIKFLNKILINKDYLKRNIEKIFTGKSGLVDSEGNDIFKENFKFIKKLSVSQIIEDIYQKIFGGEGRLELSEIKNADGEIGLKAATGKKYFGVINVGDTRTLKKLLKKLKVEVKEDYLSKPLFFEINESNSYINILLGSKKFIEGWNSWRVSNMVLINTGKGEGPQIIQLFGRGVRLKGRNFSLKREVNPNYELKVLQTLFIFGLNANYIEAFLNAIEREGIDYKEIITSIKGNKLEKEIYTIKPKKDFDFLNYPIKLEFDPELLEKIKIDLRPKISIAKGLKVGKANIIIEKPIEISDSYFKLLDWDMIYSKILNYKIAKKMFNLLIDKDLLKQIILSKKYKIYIVGFSGVEIEYNGGKPVLKITSFDGIRKFHDLILMVLKNYIQVFYKRKKRTLQTKQKLSF